VQGLVADCDHTAIRKIKNVDAFVSRCEMAEHLLLFILLGAAAEEFRLPFSLINTITMQIKSREQPIVNKIAVQIPCTQEGIRTHNLSKQIRRKQSHTHSNWANHRSICLYICIFVFIHMYFCVYTYVFLCLCIRM
jgi:hypothetical protein